jgi:hypothetical protein
MNSRTFYVPEYNRPKLEAAIEKLNRKAAKLGTDPITLEVLGYEDRESDQFGPVRVFEIAIAGGPEPILGDWELIAKLEPAREGNVVKTLLGKTAVPDRYRTERIWCDHCNLDRVRHSSYLVRHVTTGEYKQVGTSCLADFTGHGDPELIAQRAEWLGFAYDAADEAGYDPDLDRSGRGPERFYLDQYLAWVVATIKRYGWLSRSRAEYRGHSTADTALHFWKTPRQHIEAHNYYEPTEADEQEAKAAIAWVRTELAARADLSEYEHNLVLVCSEDSIPFSWIGYAASLIPAYGREVEQRTRIENEGGSEWQGAVKERQEWGPLTLIAVHSFESRFGTCYLYKFQDQSGNVFVWKTGNQYDWQQGEQFAGKATVKAHDEYKGVKQTVLTRCAFEVVEPVAA